MNIDVKIIFTNLSHGCYIFSSVSLLYFYCFSIKDSRFIMWRKSAFLAIFHLNFTKKIISYKLRLQILLFFRIDYITQFIHIMCILDQQSKNKTVAGFILSLMLKIILFVRFYLNFTFSNIFFVSDRWKKQ